MAPHERLGEHEAAALREIERLLDVGSAAAVGLLAEDVLARFERTHRPFVVERVRQRDVHGVDAGVREQSVVRAVCARDVVLTRVCVGAPLVSARDRNDLDVGRAGACDHDAIDVRRREDAPAGHAHVRGA